MNKYLKEYFRRGLMFAGFGPIVYAIVIFILSLTLDSFTITGKYVLLGVLSTYIIAFVQAGSNVFYLIEHWPTLKSLFWHFLSLYIVYSVGYVVNSWIPFEPIMLLIFTGVFVAIYFAVWLIVCVILLTTERKLNKKLK